VTAEPLQLNTAEARAAVALLADMTGLGLVSFRVLLAPRIRDTSVKRIRLLHS
jgi:hypothetical protein